MNQSHACSQFPFARAGLNLWTLPEEAGTSVSAVTIAPDGQRLLVGAGSSVWLAQGLDGEDARQIGGHDRTVGAVALAPDGRTALSGGQDRVVKVWDLDSGAVTAVLDKHRGAITQVGFLPDGVRAVTASADRTLRLWDLERGRTIRILKHTLLGEVRTFAPSPDGARLISGGGGALALWDLETLKARRILQLKGGFRDGQRVEGAYVPLLGTSATSIAYLPCGRRFVWGGGDTFVTVADAETGATLHVLGGHRARVVAVAVDPRGRFVLSVAQDGALRVWSLADLAGDPEVGAIALRTAFEARGRTVSRHGLNVYDLSLAPDGGWCAVATDLGLVRVRSVKAG